MVSFDLTFPNGCRAGRRVTAVVSAELIFVYNCEITGVDSVVEILLWLYRRRFLG